MKSILCGWDSSVSMISSTLSETTRNTTGPNKRRTERFKRSFFPSYCGVKIESILA